MLLLFWNGFFRHDLGVIRKNEAGAGIEPANGAFAEPCLTTWLSRPGAEYRARVLKGRKGFPSPLSDLQSGKPCGILLPLLVKQLILPL